jgi:hypothetical protein
MKVPQHIESIIGILTSAVIAGAWWFAAFRLQRLWFLYGLAVVATIGA